MAVNEIELEEQLKKTGTLLLNPPSDAVELLNLLDKMESLLVNVEQSPSKSMQEAIVLPSKALISSVLLRHADDDVRVSVASCISEITRLTAPEAPYNDDEMKEFFRLTVTAFEKLAHLSSRCYAKAVSMLDIVAKVRSCLVMLDLELDELVLEMFQHFLNIISSNHPNEVFCAMETIMTLVIDESEDISSDLLSILLASVRKKNQSVSPMAWKLGNNVLANCAVKLKPYLKDALQSVRIAINDYSPLVASISQNEVCDIDLDHFDAYVATSSKGTASIRDSDTPMSDGGYSKVLEHCSLNQQSKKGDAETKFEMEPETIRQKRGRKPNSLMNPEEGYDYSWICNGRKSAKSPCERNHQKGMGGLSSRNLVFEKVALPQREEVKMEKKDITQKLENPIHVSSPSPSQRLSSGRHRKRSQPKEYADHSSLSLSRRKISSTRIKKGTVMSDDESLRNQRKSRFNLERKQDNCSKSAKMVAKSDSCKSLAKLEPKKDILDETKQSLQQSAKGKVRSTVTDSLSIKKCSKKRNALEESLDENASLASFCKKTKLSGNYGTCQDEIPKSNIKQKRTPRKEVDSKTPELGEDLIGTRIKVWWPLDKMFYEGVVDSYDPVKKKHKVIYDDGDEETLNLTRQQWEPIKKDILPEKGLELDLPKPDTSLNIIWKGKANGNAKSETGKKLKSASSSRRECAGTSKTKSRLGGKSSSVSIQKEPVIVEKAVNDGSPKSGSIANDDGKDRC